MNRGRVRLVSLNTIDQRVILIQHCQNKKNYCAYSLLLSS